jgi:hypothetical protein
MQGSGFQWYDTGQVHIVSQVTFRSCGTSTANSAGGGCDVGSVSCRDDSTVWGLLAHSDQFVPEFMQATKGITYEDCGRRFRMVDYVRDSGETHGNGLSSTASERIQSWLDADGTASGLGVPAIIGAAVSDAGAWWHLDDECVLSADAPLWFCATRGTTRQVGSLYMHWEGQPSGIGVDYW